jgi:serine phosphatase RsbU (regulator of sigma subunit)
MNHSIGYASRPYLNRHPNGDGWLVIHQGSLHRLMLADGIGHGSKAHAIVELLKQQLLWISQRSTQWIGIDHCLQDLHRTLVNCSSTSQAAVALVDLDCDSKQQTTVLAGISIGNIEVQIQAGSSQTCLPTLPGMVGGHLPTELPISTYQLAPDSIVSLFSDGVEARAAKTYLRHVTQNHRWRAMELRLVARVIVEQFGRLTDDASCLLIRPGCL